MSRIVRVNVTLANIEAGQKGDCEKCPLALAISEAIGAPCIVTANNWWLTGSWPTASKHFTYLPLTACQFIADFDAGKTLKPFSFDVEAP